MSLILKNLYRDRLIRKSDGGGGVSTEADSPVGDDGVLRKMVGVIKSLNKKDKIIRVIASDESVDRYGDVCLVSSWNNKLNKENYFGGNPVLLWCHNRDSSFGMKPLGIVENPTYEQSFDVDANFKGANAYKEAEEIWQLYVNETLRAFSVGFRPVTVSFEPVKIGQTGFTFTESSLLELSAVPIPANPNALKKSFDDGVVSEETLQLHFKPYLNAVIKNHVLFLPDNFNVKSFENLEFILKDNKTDKELACTCKTKEAGEVVVDSVVAQEATNELETFEVAYECYGCEKESVITVSKADYELESNQIEFLGEKIYNAVCPNCNVTLKDIGDLIVAHNLV